MTNDNPLRARLYGVRMDGPKESVPLQRPMVLHTIQGMLNGCDQEGIEPALWATLQAVGLRLAALSLTVSLQDVLAVRYEDVEDDELDELLEDDQVEQLADGSAPQVKVRGYTLATPAMLSGEVVELELVTLLADAVGLAGAALPDGQVLQLALSGVERADDKGTLLDALADAAPISDGWRAEEHSKPRKGVLRFESAAPVPSGQSVELEATAEGPDGERFPARQITVRPLGFAELPAGHWSLESVRVNGEEQLAAPGVPLSLFEPREASSDLYLPTQLVGNRTVIRVRNDSRTEARPFACAMAALYAEPQG